MHFNPTRMTPVMRHPNMNRWLAIPTLAAAAWVDTLAADSADARCDIYPRGSDHLLDAYRAYLEECQGAGDFTIVEPA
jgi:hypothetical protein